MQKARLGRLVICERIISRELPQGLAPNRAEHLAGLPTTRTPGIEPGRDFGGHDVPWITPGEGSRERVCGTDIVGSTEQAV